MDHSVFVREHGLNVRLRPARAVPDDRTVPRNLARALQFSVASKFVRLCYTPVCTQVGSVTEDIQTNQEADPKTSWWSSRRG